MKLRSAYIAGIALWVFTACSQQKPVEKKETTKQDESLVQLTDAQVKNAGIVTAKAERRNMATELKVNGQIDVPPQNIVSISFPLGGYLESTKLLPGVHVNKGSVVAIMEDQQYIQLQQDYLTAKARLAFLEKEYARQQALNQSKASSDKQFQQTESEYRSQQIQLKALSEKLQLISVNPASLTEANLSRHVNIYSPINGFVTKVNVNIGKYVNATDVLFEIVNPDDIHLGLTVFEKDVDKLAIGQKVWAYTNGNPNKKYECEVILVGQDFAPDRSIQVHCHFESYDKSLIPGTFMNALIETAADSVLALPEEAVVRYQNNQYAFLQKDNNIFEMVQLKTGGANNGYIAIQENREDLAHATFVTRGAYSLLMKLKNAGEEEE